jgi:hypothetical protein
VKTLGGWILARPLTPHDAMGWVLRVARGLDPLHELDVAHGRVTAESIVCEAPGCAARGLLLDADEVTRDYNYYSAVRCKLSGASPEDDVWALGVLLYHCLTGAFPFPGEHRRAVQERIEWRKPSPIAVYNVAHPRLQALLDRLLLRGAGPKVVTLQELIDSILSIDPSLDDLPALVFGVATGDEVSAVHREPGRSEVRAAELERTVDRVRRELDADEEAIVLERLVDGIAKDVARESPSRGVYDSMPPSSQETAPSSAWLRRDRDVPPASMDAPRRRRSSWHVLGIAATAALVVLLLYTSGRGYRSTSNAAAKSTPSVITPAASITSRPRIADVSRCVADIFDRDTFQGAPPSFDWLCRETNPQKGADALESELLIGTGTRDTTTAMRLWTRLNWYELALVAAARERCCTPSKPLTTTGRCSFEARLRELGSATAWGDDRSFRLAMADYAKAADCLVDAQAAAPLARDGRPSAGEADAFAKATARLRTHPD